MKNSLLNLNKESVQTLERALNFYLDNGLAKEIGDIWVQANCQPSATTKIMLEGEYFKSLVKERERTNLLQKQIAYQKRLLKV